MSTQASTPKKERHGMIRVFKNCWFLARYAFRYTPSYIFVVLCEAIGRAGDHILGVLFLKYLFDAIERGDPYTHILAAVGIVGGYSILFELFNKWRLEVYNPRTNLKLHEGMQNELYRRARALDLACYDDPAFYDDFVWAMREADGRLIKILSDLSLFLNRVICSAVVLGLLVVMEPVVAAVLLITVLLGLWLKAVINRLCFERTRDLTLVGRKLSYIGRIFYMPDHAKELRLGGMAETLIDRYGDATEEKIGIIRKYENRLMWLLLASHLLTSTVPQAGVVGYLVVRYVTDPTLTLGTLSASITATFKLYWTLDDIGNYLTKFNEHSLYIEKFKRFLDYEPTVRGEITDIPPIEHLAVRDVTFRYPFTEGESTLKKISLDIRRGEKIAFVGYNGAGKTTLIKLLLRLYDPTEGEILINGRSLRDLDPEAYRRAVGVVFQDYKVFAATVAENVLAGDFTPDREQTVTDALRAASFEEKAASLPEGIHTPLTREFDKKGTGLSGGEAQKVAIARAFARVLGREGGLLIMDEPSSALDPIAEYELNRSIMENAADRTVIFISHRLSTTRMADRIYMFDGGTLIESGSHAELMAKNGKYAEMYRVQAKKYREEW